MFFCFYSYVINCVVKSRCDADICKNINRKHITIEVEPTDKIETVKEKNI